MARAEAHLLQFFYICAIGVICGQILFVCISTSEFGFIRSDEFVDQIFEELLAAALVLRRIAIFERVLFK